MNYNELFASLPSPALPKIHKFLVPAVIVFLGCYLLFDWKVSLLVALIWLVSSIRSFAIDLGHSMQSKQLCEIHELLVEQARRIEELERKLEI